ncbi:ABC transporter permease [Parapusillimonas granuli]|uniref:ABC transporter permease n=1 Tax=Parapusillimonas granuli TaxID=380911 RepID=A0A853FUV4_9BURK|nr:ABC transporter permease [Parapusillimonas granuli]MBB5215588.1 peptide/nickel transport system permease protein [Parapusillimonas granuli]NYT49745.1 ABC transporter permease [Parapusillimonas granuli]
MLALIGGSLPRIFRRLFQGVLTILVIVVLNFFLLHSAPGDAAEVLAGEAGSSTPEYIAQLREEFGMDKPLAVQLGVYVKNILTLNLGYSFRAAKPVKDLITERLGATLLLMGTTLVISVGMGVLLGALAARWLNTWKDNLISLGALISYATPMFWAGLMLIVLFSIHLGWLPTSGMENISAFYEGWERVLDIGRHLVLPATTLSLFYLAFYTRLMRASMLEQSGLDYVTTARAKGLTERQIVFGHMLRNAVLPVVTMAGMQIGAMLGGSVVVETVFAWPGLGYLAFQALFARDLNLLLSIFFICAILVVVANLLVDVLYSVLDPRIRTA